MTASKRARRPDQKPDLASVFMRSAGLTPMTSAFESIDDRAPMLPQAS